MSSVVLEIMRNPGAAQALLEVFQKLLKGGLHHRAFGVDPLGQLDQGDGDGFDFGEIAHGSILIVISMGTEYTCQIRFAIHLWILYPLPMRANLQLMVRALIRAGYTEEGIAKLAGTSQPTVNRLRNGLTSTDYVIGKRIEILYERQKGKAK